MKSTPVNSCSYFICMVVMQLCAAGICNAQTISLKPPPPGVVIDGDAGEWGDMRYSDTSTNISYTLSNDNDNLYLVIKTNDHTLEANILGSGVTLGIDMKGRKKSTYTITYPVSGAEDAGMYMDMGTEQFRSTVELTKYRKMSAEGFDDIGDELLTVPNPYNINAAIGYSADGYLVYEEAIPLTLFNAGKMLNNEWVFNIKINGLQKKKQGLAALNGPSDYDNAHKTSKNIMLVKGEVEITELTPSVDFWVKFNLAKEPITTK